MDAHEILNKLQIKKNILLLGAPGTGKSKMMNDVVRIFEAGAIVNSPTHIPGASIPIPASIKNVNIGAIPMLQKSNRKVFRTTLHQNTKYRDFITGITPRIDGCDGYQISKGILYRANEFAKQADSAALLIIDELNRGPAVEVFGGSIVAIENDKRLNDNNTPSENTQFFEILNPETGDYVEYAFSPNLYILAAMNQADVSVAPLDVAFMRRWMAIKLEPDYSSVYAKFNIQNEAPIPTENPSVHDIFHVAILALEKINKKISIGRGSEYQLGQGIFLSTSPNGNTENDALDFVIDVWMMIYAHIEELFFGEPIALAYILNANNTSKPYYLEEVTFAGETKFILSHIEINRETIYKLYYSILEDNN